ncbi:hypothetical protein IW136_003215 [Coemansia sp. RSA 678]|nr:hypothetical protein IW136_003215 [Coemansia sp. RSA 678]
MAHPLAAAHIILAAIAEIAGAEAGKEQATVPAAGACDRPADIQQRLDEAKRMYAIDLQHVRV